MSSSLRARCAAVRLRSLSPIELEARLARRFAVLKAEVRGTVPRQQSLAALIDWSYELLSASEQLLLAQLSVFAASGFDLAAVEAVCARGEADIDETIDGLDSLVDKSLVQAQDSGGTMRYRMLESVRDYAARQLAETFSRHDHETRTAHRDHYLALAEDAWSRLRSAQAPAAYDLLRAERDNLRLAETHSLVDPDPAPGLRLATALQSFRRSSGAAVEGGR